MTKDDRREVSADALKAFFAEIAIYIVGKSHDGEPIDVQDFLRHLQSMEQSPLASPEVHLTKTQMRTYEAARKLLLQQIQSSLANWDHASRWYKGE